MLLTDRFNKEWIYYEIQPLKGKAKKNKPLYIRNNHIFRNMNKQIEYLKKSYKILFTKKAIFNFDEA